MSDGGKGSKRRIEDRAAVEANWPTNWNARGEHQPATPPVLHGQVEEEAGGTTGEGAAVLDVQPDGASGSSYGS